MTDDWTPNNLPIMLMNRSLLSSTKAKPFKIGEARVTAADEESLVAFDKVFEAKADEQGDRPLPSRYEVQADWLSELVDLPYQVSYYFPSSVRNNRTAHGSYGSPGMTNRVLYEALCDAFNGGRRFIEDYFLSAFRDHMEDRYERAIKELKQQIVNEAQQRRIAHKAYLKNFSVWSSPMVESTFHTLAKETKKDIVASLSTGKIPLLREHPSAATLEKRRKLGIASDKVFFATGRLIGSIVVSVILVDPSTAAVEGVA